MPGNIKARQLRLQIISQLGGTCNWPGCSWTDARALDIDHVNGGGLEESSYFNSESQKYGFYLSQIESGSKEYQILCCNHNRIKARERGESSHRRVPLSTEKVEAINKWLDAYQTTVGNSAPPRLGRPGKRIGTRRNNARPRGVSISKALIVRQAIFSTTATGYELKKIKERMRGAHKRHHTVKGIKEITCWFCNPALIEPMKSIPVRNYDWTEDSPNGTDNRQSVD